MLLYTKCILLSKAIFLPFKIVTSDQTHEVWQNYKQEEHISKRNVKSCLNDSSSILYVALQRM